MPLYQFELVGAESTTSLDGALLEDDHQAEGIALGLAGDVRTMRPELIAQGYKVVVRDESGNEIFHIPLDRV
jgi:hypothetical protein